MTKLPNEYDPKEEKINETKIIFISIEKYNALIESNSKLNMVMQILAKKYESWNSLSIDETRALYEALKEKEEK